jgi:hypothetical protein
MSEWNEKMKTPVLAVGMPKLSVKPATSGGFHRREKNRWLSAGNRNNSTHGIHHFYSIT